eukprot:scaffold18384_cov20-Tisochrysis_lutea.AAC.1
MAQMQLAVFLLIVSQASTQHMFFPESMPDTHFCWMPAMVDASALCALAMSRANLCSERRNS